MNSRIRFSTKRLPTSLGPLLALYVFGILRLHLRNEIQVQTLTPLNIVILFSGLVSLGAISFAADMLAPRKGILNFAVNGLVVIAYAVLSTYHLRSRVFLDYAVLAENPSLLFHRESLNLIAHIPGKYDYVAGIVALAAVALLHWKWNESAPAGEGRPWRPVAALLAAYVGCLLFLPYSYDEMTCFAQSAYQYYVPRRSLFEVPNPAEAFPYVTQIVNAVKSDPPQNVFVIMIESFNANFVRTRTPEGEEYTPFFNELTRQGVFFDNFWGNSVQTVKGQMSVLSSIPPLTRKKVFSDYPDLKLHCLPQIMKENGYETVFFQGFGDLDFDNTGTFMKRNGFTHVHAMNEEFVSAEESRQYKWGWGIQDNILYQKTFQYLDKISAANPMDRKKRGFFVLLATISNHSKFKNVPESQRYLYKDPQGRKEFHANSIRVTDEYLKTFFSELKKRDNLSNSIVIITGDHSFPAGEHGYYDSESGFYNEYFRTPLLIWGKGISPGVSHDLHCQMDIAPTILELTGISARTHFRGKSVFSGASAFVPLVQPYAGVYLSVISYPYKYVYWERGRKEFLFDLGKDPLEKTNDIASVFGKPLYETFHQEVAQILVNDRLVQEDRIWPGSE